MVEDADITPEDHEAGIDAKDDKVDRKRIRIIIADWDDRGRGGRY